MLTNWGIRHYNYSLTKLRNWELSQYWGKWELTVAITVHTGISACAKMRKPDVTVSQVGVYVLSPFPVHIVISCSCCLLPCPILPLSHSLTFCLVLLLSSINIAAHLPCVLLISLYQGCYSSWPYRVTT